MWVVMMRHFLIVLSAISMIGCAKGALFGHLVRDRHAEQQQAKAQKAAEEKRAQAREQELRTAQRIRMQQAHNVELLAHRAAIVKEARELGFKVVFDAGMSRVVEYMINNNTDTSATSKTAIELDVFWDSQIKALQVLNDGSALYSDARTNTVLLLQKHQRPILEGSRLTALGFNYFVIVGTKNYSTLLGSRQAFVIEPIPLGGQ